MVNNIYLIEKSLLFFKLSNDNRLCKLFGSGTDFVVHVHDDIDVGPGFHYWCTLLSLVE